MILDSARIEGLSDRAKSNVAVIIIALGRGIAEHNSESRYNPACYTHKSCTIAYQGFQLWSPLK